ncbi:MAG: peptide ABC transporter substrate-binding protein, partial [Pyrinomonadaceae bacterium]
EFNMAYRNFGLHLKLLSLFLFSTILAACSSSANSRYFGQTKAPSDNIMRYISGSEPESLDPQITNGQPEARILIGLYDGLIEYHPKTMEPIPGVAESWEISPDGTEYLFHLRQNAKFSNGDPITARDFVYTFRRGFSPELASRSANLGYYVKYSEAYNAVQSFVRSPDGSYLLKKDFAESQLGGQTHDTLGADTEFHRFLDSPERLSVPSDQAAREKLLKDNPKLKSALVGKELVPVKAEDVGIEAIDDYTLRIKLYQPAPYFLGVLGHQFFRVIPQKIVEKFGIGWSRPENIVTSGVFKVVTHRPYDVLIVARDPNNWDAANVHLDGMEYYPLDEQSTMLNLYKAGRVDAIYNHTIPAPWNETIRKFTAEYSLHPEVATEFYLMNIKKPPMDNLKVRQAFSLAIDRESLAQFRKTMKPLVDMTPEGIFPKYEEAREKVYSEQLKKKGSSLEEWKARIFDAERARKLMTEAGFPVKENGGRFSCPSFPADEISITYNTSENNKAIAEFVQAQWKQYLGITVPLKNMEFRTFLPLINKVQYEGFARRGWVGDYMDPYTFLGLYYSKANEGGTGWWDPKFDQLLDDANNIVDVQKRNEKLAEAEFYVMQQQIIIPLGTQGTSWMKKPYIKGMYPNPGTLHPWKFVYIERDQSKWTTDMDNILTLDDPLVTAQLDQITSTQELRENVVAATNAANGANAANAVVK